MTWGKKEVESPKYSEDKIAVTHRYPVLQNWTRKFLTLPFEYANTELFLSQNISYNEKPDRFGSAK